MVHSTTCFLTLLAFSALTIHGAPMKSRANLDDANTAVSKLQCGGARTCDSPNDTDPDEGEGDAEFQSSQDLLQLCNQDPKSLPCSGGSQALLQLCSLQPMNPACKGGTFQFNPALDQHCAILPPNYPGCGKSNSILNGSILPNCTQNPNDPACRGGVSQSNPGVSETCVQNPKQSFCDGNNVNVGGLLGNGEDSGLLGGFIARKG